MIDFRDMLGKPYKTGGRGPDNYDCYGCFIEVMRRYGKEFPDFLYDELTAELEARLVHTRKALVHAEKIGEPKEGVAVVFFVAGLPRHVGVCVDAFQFIHCGRYGVRIEDLSSWSKRIEGFYTW